MKRSNKKWLIEGKDHKHCKDILRTVARKYRAGAVEEERFPVDLHDIEPELYPHKSIRGYQADLFITQRRGKTLYRVIAEVDGGYHNERKEDDELRDRAILQHYGIQVVRFQKEALLNGEYSEEQIAEMLGLI